MIDPPRTKFLKNEKKGPESIMVPSAFRASERGDKLAESWTHADGVIGHF
jgi:hypothetical protein